MKNYIVGAINFFDNNLKLEKISAENEIEAINKHSMINGFSFESKTLEEAKVEAFDMDMMVDVIEI